MTPINCFLEEHHMPTRLHRRRLVLAPALMAGLALLTLTACGSSGGSTTASSSASTPAVAAPSGAPSNLQGQFAKIQACLSAAGIANAAPSGGIPSGGIPSGAPTGAPPSGGNFTPPTGGGQAGLQDPKVKAALAACGISLPSQGSRPSGAPTPGSS